MSTTLATLLHDCAITANKNEPTSVDARARSFVSSLAAGLQATDPQLAAEVFTVLLNVPTMSGVAP